MQMQCGNCKAIYDDAGQLTFCPHDPIMDPSDLQQKDAGLALIGKTIRFAHQPDGPDHSVQSVGWNGMLTLRDMTGEFAPHLFITAEDGEKISRLDAAVSGWRDMKHDNDKPVFAADGTMLDEHGNRSIFDDVDE